MERPTEALLTNLYRWTYQALVLGLTTFESNQSQTTSTSEFCLWDVTCIFHKVDSLCFLHFYSFLDLLIPVLTSLQTQVFENVFAPLRSTEWARDLLIILNLMSYPPFHTLSVHIFTTSKFTKCQVLLQIHDIVTNTARLLLFKLLPLNLSLLTIRYFYSRFNRLFFLFGFLP